MQIGYIDNIIPSKKGIAARLKILFRRNDESLAEIVRTNGIFKRKFTISSCDFSEDKIIGSTFASPARYLMAIFQRLSSAGPGANQHKLIVTPVFGVPENAIIDVLKDVLADAENTTIKIFSDAKGYPVAYYLPKTITDAESRYLSLLSTVNACSDKELLKHACLTGVKIISINYDLNLMTLYNKFFFNRNYRDIYTWIADAAVKCLANKYGKQLQDDCHQTMTSAELAEMKRKRDSVPFTAVMPHHAGDVLFLALAIKNAKTYLNCMIISNWYKDILESDFKEIAVKTIDLLPMMRDGNKKTDEEIFLDMISTLSSQEQADSFYYYCRPSREFWVSNFHMIDQFGFAVGETIDTDSNLLSKRCLTQNRVPESLSPPYKILLHFEGGWPLKAYPVKQQSKLIKMFCASGYQLTILTSSCSSTESYRAVKYTNLADYKKLLMDHHLIVGMDSFPIHYAAFITGTPAMCLFGNTIPMVSFGHRSNYYSCLDNNMNCTHCGGVDRCPSKMKSECDNFPVAETVYNAARAMLNKLYF